MEASALEPVQARAPVVQQSIFALAPAEMVARASQIATVLKDVVTKQRLSKNIQGKDYLMVDAWATLGTLLGVMPRERNVVEHPNGDFEAYVDLVSQATGVVIGGGSALCSVDEARWAKAERYARRSMAITRATGKAYRLCFAWVVSLAGYSATPAEEMPEEDRGVAPAVVRAQVQKDRGAKFSSDRKADLDYLEAQLKDRLVADDLWDPIAVAMRGRYADELDAVIAEVLKQ